MPFRINSSNRSYYFYHISTNHSCEFCRSVREEAIYESMQCGPASTFLDLKTPPCRNSKVWCGVRGGKIIRKTIQDLWMPEMGYQMSLPAPLLGDSWWQCDVLSYVVWGATPPLPPTPLITLDLKGGMTWNKRSHGEELWAATLHPPPTLILFMKHNRKRSRSLHLLDGHFSFCMSWCSTNCFPFSFDSSSDTGRWSG